MDVRLSLVRKVDGKAVAPLTHLIMSYIETHPNVGCVVICRDKVSFTKGIFFEVGRIDYVPYGLVYRNGVIYYEGMQSYSVPQNNRAHLLFCLLLQLDGGHVGRI